ncbi:coiled-coil domain-containing protein 87-like [Oscarella lobularis]|uniref:coiled-coil domain-containing protein 87-like n=1 Tax=Oscarella lobularis TaxID=121494 RepID=UPI003313E395
MVFNTTANASRLKAQIAVEANRKLNVLSIRRRALEKMRSPAADFSFTTHRLTAHSSRPLVSLPEQLEKRRINRELKELNQKMPTVSRKTKEFLDQQPEYINQIREQVMLREPSLTSRHSQKSAAMRADSQRSDTTRSAKQLLGKSKSMPCLRERTSALTCTAIKRWKSLEPSQLTREMPTDSSSDTLLNVRLTAAEDLKRLVIQRQINTLQDEFAEDGDDLPPLLQAINRWHPRKRVQNSRKKSEEESASTKSNNEPDERESSCVSTAELPSQPAVITTRIPSMYKAVDVVRTSAARISERKPRTCLTLHPLPPAYNELAGEVDPSEAKWMDRNLYRGQEVKEVYDEIWQTVEDEHLFYDQDPIVEVCASLSSKDVDSTLTSFGLRHRRSQRIINETLRKASQPPWKVKGQEEWILSNQYQGPIPAELLAGRSTSGPLPSDVMRATRQYEYWLTWWRSTIDTEDYLKFAARKDSDFLHHIFHLYDSEGTDSEDEERAAEQEAVERKKKAKERERKEKMKRLREKKQAFKGGMWNVNTVAMGGLGEDPELRGDSQSSDQEVEEITDIHKELDVVREQERFEFIWKALKMPEKQRLDMAIKYSTLDKRGHLDQALCLWEACVDAITKREAVIAELEAFERTASNPHRFFTRGSEGNSATRLAEATARGKIHRRLETIEAVVTEAVVTAQQKLGDCITFEGRPYMEKLRLDKTEMLYWLQQERRRALLNVHAIPVSHKRARVFLQRRIVLQRYLHAQRGDRTRILPDGTHLRAQWTKQRKRLGRNVVHVFVELTQRR